VRLYRIKVLSEVDSNVVFILVAACRTVVSPLNFVIHTTEWYSWLSDWSWNINFYFFYFSASSNYNLVVLTNEQFKSNLNY
jgi:hypothetical protein